MSTERPLLEVADLRIASRLDGRERLLVEAMRLDVRPGEAIAIVGESGSGKSMTARALTGLLPPGVQATGSVRLDGEELIGAPERRWRQLRGRRVAMLPQDPFTMLSPLRRAGDQIRDGAREDTGADDVARRLDEVGVRDPAVARCYPFELSGGLRQRVGIAATLANDPDVLIADEPTTALDVTTQRRLLELLMRLRSARGLALILITHDLRVAFAVCDRVLVLYAGALVEVGDAAAVEREPLHPYTNGLLLSEPAVERRLERLTGIPGAVPQADDVTGECPFAARCAWVRDACRAVRPPLVEHAPGRLSACVRIDEIAAELRQVRERAAAPDAVEPVAGEPVLRVRDVGKVFPGRRGGRVVHALRRTSIEVRTGEVVGIVGESGSGKTTLARIVAGLERADEGTIELPGMAPRGKREPSPVQVVFQDPSSTLNPSRRVGDTLAEALRAAGRPRDAQAVAALLAQVGLPASYAARKPAALSGGERQRVAIARALAPEPRVLLCDEPVSALDVSVQAQILELFRELGARLGIALLFITHDLGVVRQVADRVYVLCEGEVVEHGPVARVLDAPSHPYTRELLASVPRSDGAWLANGTATLV